MSNATINFAPATKLVPHTKGTVLDDFIFRTRTAEPVCVGTMGPLGMGRCAKARPADSKAGVRYSVIALYLWDLFRGQINFRSSADSIYGEAVIDEKVYRFVCDGETASFEKAIPENEEYLLLPFALFHLRQESEYEYFRAPFEKAKEEYLADEKCKPAPILEICDGFHWGAFKKGVQPISVDADLVIETAQQAVRSGHLVEDRLFKGLKPLKFTGINIGETETKKTYADLSYDEIKSGAARLDFAWNPEQQLLVPDAITTLEEYIPCDHFNTIVGKVKTKGEKILARMKEGKTGLSAIGKDAVNLFITGKPGTGKTSLAYALGAATGMPVYSINITKNTEEDTFQGMNKVIDGSLSFVSTSFLEAYTHGGIILLEEINLSDPGVVMGAIGQAVEFPYILMKDGYIPVQRHPLCVIIGTMNIGTNGSKGVNQALSTRFRNSYVLNDPTKEEFLSILGKNGAGKKVCNWVYDIYNNISNYLKSPKVNAEDICMVVGLRSCMAAVDDIVDEGVEPKKAIQNTLIGKIAEIDLLLAEEVMSSVVDPSRDLY